MVQFLQKTTTQQKPTHHLQIQQLYNYNGNIMTQVTHRNNI